MENASKALLIIASVLMSLLVIGVLLFTYNKLANVEQNRSNVEAEEKLRDYSQQFAQYEKDAIYGTEIMSLANLWENYNLTSHQMEGYPEIKIKVTITRPVIVKVDWINADSSKTILINEQYIKDSGEYDIDVIRKKINKELKQTTENKAKDEFPLKNVKTGKETKKTVKEWCQIRPKEIAYYAGMDIENIPEEDLETKLEENNQYVKIKKGILVYEGLLRTYNEFKNTLFKCTEFKKNNNNQVGIVDSIKFLQQ